jgi:hypothetical protein
MRTVNEGSRGHLTDTFHLSYRNSHSVFDSRRHGRFSGVELLLQDHVLTPQIALRRKSIL